jgi:Tol biopolymer transport system component
VTATPISLSPGDRLGRYEVVALLGAGGMGEVYRAHDPHLKRDVALKIVRRPEANAEQLARFAREARAASSLNHPNIVAVYDAGVEAGTPYVVTELLEGETLRARLDRGPLPYRKALDCGIQIALALDAAHAGRIWHRDVKPANVFLMNDGRVKLLDFGIAKLAERSWHAEANEPTGDPSESREVIGTAGYMAPEQVLGKAIDHRADIFALGTVLYEMFTRTRAFKRGSSVETMNAVLHEDPADPVTLNPSLPPVASTIVRRCLEKNKEERFQSARDLAFDLQQLRDVTTSSRQLRVRSFGGRRRLIRGVLVASLLLAGVAVGWLLRPAAELATFKQLTFSRARIGAARFVAGGRSVVYSEARERDPLELLRIDLEESVSPRSLAFNPGTEILAASASEIALSMDRRFLIGERFVGTLAIAPMGGGTPVEKEENIEDADWDPDGKQLTVVRSIGGMGGTSALEYPIRTKRYETGHSIRFPRVSRDGRRIAFLEDRFGSGDGGYVTLLDLADNRVTVLTDRFRNARGLAWSADGSEIWFTAGDSRAHRMLQAVTPNRRTRVVMDVPGSLTLFDIAADGKVLLTRDDERRSLVGLPPGEKAERDLSVYDDSGLADVADDGRRVLFSDRFGVYLRSTDGAPPQRIGNIDAYADDLSPDGLKVLATRTTEPELVIVPIKPGPHQTVPAYNIVSYQGARWFPEGQRIIFTGRDGPEKNLRSFIQDLRGGAPTALTPEGIWALAIDDTGKLAAAIGDTQDGVSIWPIPSGPSRLVRGSRKGDRPVAWTSDGRALWMFRRYEVPLEVVRLDIETGNREIWKTLVPSDVTGVYSITEFAITPSGDAYFYSFRRLLSQLYQVRGLR